MFYLRHIISNVIFPSLPVHENVTTEVAHWRNLIQSHSPE
tara:strand:+ start:1320 stop:1439 length:120 start_codon:yes stop_codon:yes gene_type:complete